jgi:hypothetical protein
LLNVSALVVQGFPFPQEPSILMLPVLRSPPVNIFTEIVSIVKRAVFVGWNESGFELMGTKRKTYVPFAHIAVPVTPPHDTVTVPTVQLEIVNFTQCSRYRFIHQTVCDNGEVPLEECETEFDE